MEWTKGVLGRFYTLGFLLLEQILCLWLAKKGRGIGGGWEEEAWRRMASDWLRGLTWSQHSPLPPPFGLLSASSRPTPRRSSPLLASLRYLRCAINPRLLVNFCNESVLITDVLFSYFLMFSCFSLIFLLSMSTLPFLYSGDNLDPKLRGYNTSALWLALHKIWKGSISVLFGIRIHN